MLSSTKSIAPSPNPHIPPSVRVSGATRKVTTMAKGGFDSNWLKKDGMVLALGFAGWTIPASIPVSGFGGNSLFFKFTESIGSELAHFPQGPAVTDEFWTLLVLYHVGLFLSLTLAQIGVQGRKQGYFN